MICFVPIVYVIYILALFSGSKNVIFSLFFAPKSAPSHYMLWLTSTFSRPNHYVSSELSLLRAMAIQYCYHWYIL